MIFFQETHSDFNNDTDWRLWWIFFIFFFLSHGYNLSAGVSILFSSSVKEKFLSKEEIEPGRLLAVHVKIYDFCFVFVNIYAPNGGSDRIFFFNKLQLFLR